MLAAMDSCFSLFRFPQHGIRSYSEQAQVPKTWAICSKLTKICLLEISRTKMNWSLQVWFQHLSSVYIYSIKIWTSFLIKIIYAIVKLLYGAARFLYIYVNIFCLVATGPPFLSTNICVLPFKCNDSLRSNNLLLLLKLHTYLDQHFWHYSM